MTGPEYEPTDDERYLMDLAAVTGLSIDQVDDLTAEDEFDQGQHGVTGSKGAHG